MSKYAAKYSDEQISEAVRSGSSIRSVLLSLGMSESGGSRQHLNRRISLLHLDTSHFTGQAWTKGKHSPRKKHWSEFLIVRTPTQGKQNSRTLRRALIESGVVEQCSKENCPSLLGWFGKIVPVEIDHGDGNVLNNVPSNLRFLCPICHALEPTSSHSWKDTPPYGTKSICSCGNRKQSRSKSCEKCYKSSRSIA